MAWPPDWAGDSRSEITSLSEGESLLLSIFGFLECVVNCVKQCQKHLVYLDDGSVPKARVSFRKDKDND